MTSDPKLFVVYCSLSFVLRPSSFALRSSTNIPKIQSIWPQEHPFDSAQGDEPVEPLAKVTYTLIAYALIIGLTRCWLNFFTRHKAKCYKEINNVSSVFLLHPRSCFARSCGGRHLCLRNLCRHHRCRQSIV